MLLSYCSMDSFNQRSQVEVISDRINSEDCYFPAYSSLPDRDPGGFIRMGSFNVILYQFQFFQKKLESTTGLNLYDVDTCV